MFRNAERHIAHFDLDSFFVSVEQLKDGRLKGRPVAVGGTGDRGVIASCSYEARKFGVHSAMPVRLARRLCPELTMVKGDYESYSRYSAIVTDIIAEAVPLYKKSSIDEFYVELTGMDRFFGAVQYTSELGQKIRKESGLSISHALASNKLLSKVATNEVKPAGHWVVPFGKEKQYLAPMPIRKLPMIGEKTGELLRQMGVSTIDLLSRIPLDMLTSLLCSNGMELWRRANGVDESPVVPYRESKSIGTENTFDTDTINPGFLHRELARMTEKVAFELRSNQQLAGCITVKIRYSDFQTVTRQATIPHMASDQLLMQKARSLFDQLYERRLLVRLIGVRLSHLVPGSYQIHLFDDTQEQVMLCQAIDSIKKQFGEQVLMRASCI